MLFRRCIFSFIRVCNVTEKRNKIMHYALYKEQEGIIENESSNLSRRPWYSNFRGIPV